MKTFKKSFIKKKLLGKASAKETFRESFIKAQSAMEYLMTYGWAILIVAVVLGALYSLGVFNGAAFLGTSCIAASGFYCTNPTLSTGGVLTVTIGQATGTTFKNAFLYFVPSGTNFSTSDPGTSIGTLNSGQQVTASIPLGVGSPYPAAYTLGTPLSGYLYLQFTDIYGTTEVNKIATVLTKVTASSSGATFSQPTSIPSGIVAYVPITLTNSQSSATPSPFQQMIQINEGNYANYIAYNGNIANFEFYTQSGQILPAWIESNNSGTLTVWVNLPNGIPASSSLTIYLGFASKTTNLLSSSGTSGIGEAPQLSSTYAQYDDGANVFDIYFNGDTPTSDFVTGGGDTVTQQTGVTLPNGAIGNVLRFTTGSSEAVTTVDMFTTTSLQNSPNYYISEASFQSDGSGIDMDWGFAQNSGTATSNDAIFVGTQFVGAYFDQAYISGGSRYHDINAQGSTTTSWRYSSLTYNSSSSFYAYIAPQLYSTSGGYSGTVSTNPIASISPLYWGWWGDVGASGHWTQFNWVRVRAYPPNGVMPSVSFGSLSSA